MFDATEVAAVSRKIGRELVARGVVNEEQLKKALAWQLQHGGHLGTCLIELAFVGEMQLGQVLSEILGFPHATPQHFASIPNPVIESVPQPLAERHTIVPIRREGKRLRLAMINPRDLVAVDEVAFSSGCQVEPWIAPEVRMVQALERYYGVPRSRRFILLGQAAAMRAAGGPRPAGGPVPSTIPLAGASTQTPPAPATAPPAVAAAPATATPPAAATPAPPPAAAAAAPAEPDLDAALGFDTGPSVAEQWASLEAESPAVAPTPATAATTEPDEAESVAAVGLWEQIREQPDYDGSFFRRPGNIDRPHLEIDFQQLAADLFQARGPEDVPRAVFDAIGARVDRAILFMVEGVHARIWDWRGFSLSPECVRGFRFDVTREPILDLLGGNEIYLGIRPKKSEYADLYGRLEMNPPRELMLMPLYVRSRLVALMHIDGGERDKVPGSVDLYRRVGRKIEVALQIFSLKRKLLIV